MSIQRVARESGVSVATVSRVFNAPQLVRSDTRGRVQAVARRLGYQPNASARTLRTHRSHVIGVALPTLLNPVFAECLEGIAEAANRLGYSILPMTTNYRREDESAAVQRMMARSVDGMVLVVANAARSASLRRLRAAGVPYVLAYNHHPRHPCVAVDGEAAMAGVVARLAACGHRRIAMVTGQLGASDRAQQRHAGFQRGLREQGLPAGRVLEVPFMDDAVRQLTAFLRQRARPTAVVCSNDLLAIRTMRVAAGLGLQVPRDLSVVGFDGIALGSDLTPALGTVVQPNHEIGERCVELLAGGLRAGHPVAASDSIVLNHAFRQGETIGPPCAGAASRDRPTH